MMLRALASGGKRVFLDGQGWARPGRLGPLILEGPLDPAAVAGVDVLKLSEEEACVLIAGIDATAPQRVGVPLIVVTLGERGAVLLNRGRLRHVGVDPVYGLADTIGAGDAFLALMAAAMEAGADALQATEAACASVSRLLRERLHAASLSL
jgi:sugar/nucleoside kinase (ribokinase family)